ncbi:membrane protein insertase YidC [Pseudonocardia endophytica]|uniref:Membrane protein insertase YidC n=1 Tax=Pseudonocardia endophytica TaxID=401976 RepID=A0A4R1I4Y2_PSEEN|nr:membrane protein insertase YidC [Pseudonocardia endophytica]TCK27659.1 YidC/Oxa1 family membrane protein insertase [Pseudonocardia endophytica]
MLNFIYYPVSAILWFWHKVFGFVLGEANGVTWALSVVFLVFTLRAILYKPFVGQVRSMRKMQEMQPEMQKLRKKYANDKQKLATEMQKLQQQNGANPLGGCLPILVQVPVFIGLFHVLREFKPGKLENYVFNADEVRSFVDSDFLGSKLGAAVFPLSNFGGQGIPSVQELGGNLVNQWIVMVPLMIAAGIFTHITARHSVARQQAQQGAMDNTQAAIMQKLMLYVFPIGVVVGAPFLPLAILFYWVSNNLWTLGQQYIVYKRIDAEETEKREKATEAARSSAPRPGQKPVRPEDRKNDDTTNGNGADATVEAVDDTPVSDDTGKASSNGNGSRPSTNGSSNGSGNGQSSGNGQAKKPGSKPVSPAGKRPSGGGGANRPKSGSRPSGSRKNKRR